VSLAPDIGLLVLGLMMKDIDRQANRPPPLMIFDMLRKNAGSIENEEVRFGEVGRSVGILGEALEKNQYFLWSRDNYNVSLLPIVPPQRTSSFGQ
jgi:hypothetical protein